MIKSGFFSLIILIILWLAVFPCTAIEPAWTFADGERKIGDIVVAPDGSTVVAGIERVVLLSQNGTVLAKEPYGDIVAQSRDGSSIVTAYSSSGSSTVYLFKEKTDASGNPTLQKMWEATTPDTVGSFAVSDNGDRIGFSTGGSSGVYVYNGTTGTRIGYSNEYSSLITISGNGNTIAGITSGQGLKVYNSSGDFMNYSSRDFMNYSSGNFIKKYDITLSGQPNSFLMDTKGSIVVFNTGPHIIAFNLSEGTELWKSKSSSDVNMLAMIPSGKYIVAGTENGTIDYYDAKGNLTWTYYSNSGTGSGQAIKAVALTRDGSKIVAGSADGKILLLDSAGNLLWMYNTGRDKIGKVAIAADGSLAVAAGDNTLYAFSIGKKSIQSIQSTPRATVSTKHSVVPETPTITMTEYSIIRKATQSPLEEMTTIIALLAVLVLCFVLRDKN
jgi:WD40 repeat protein